MFVDAVKVPPLLPNVAYARLGVGGPFVLTVPTPEGPNAPVGGSVHLVPNTAGTAYYQVVVSSAAGSGCPSVTSSVATVVLDGMVTISAEPTAINECIGGAQSTTATASGSGILSYQWQSAASQNGP